jgi:serine/threonine protein kinase
MAHLDIKLLNILRIEGKWKLADFGCVTKTDNLENKFSHQGTNNYRSPEFEKLTLEN